MPEPFLRWAGGKRWLAKDLGPLIQSRLGGGTYHEPFLGSGAVFFAAQAQRAVLSDINPELMETYRQIKADPAALKQLLSQFPATKREYLRIRSWKTEDACERAARFLFLNRNGWGGLWRENQQGVFNVPYGGGDRNHRKLLDTSVLDEASKALQRASTRLETGDFESVLANALPHDVVYCDPTYQRRTRQHFDRYGATIFAWADQERLATAARAAAERGVVVIVSNASCFGVRQLYPNALALETARNKGLGPGDASSALEEFVFVLDPAERWADWTVIGRIIGRPSGKRKNKPAMRLANASKASAGKVAQQGSLRSRCAAL